MSSCLLTICVNIKYTVLHTSNYCCFLFVAVVLVSIILSLQIVLDFYKLKKIRAESFSRVSRGRLTGVCVIPLICCDPFMDTLIKVLKTLTKLRCRIPELAFNISVCTQMSERAAIPWYCLWSCEVYIPHIHTERSSTSAASPNFQRAHWPSASLEAQNVHSQWQSVTNYSFLIWHKPWERRPL